MGTGFYRYGEKLPTTLGLYLTIFTLLRSAYSARSTAATPLQPLFETSDRIFVTCKLL